MLGALTHLRLYASRTDAIKALRDATPADAGAEAALARDLAKAAGMAHAAPFFAGEQRQDLADAALAALRRDRDLCFRILFQSGLGALFVAGLAAAGAPITGVLAALAAFLALPTWAIAFGGPDALVDVLLAAPIAGRPARDLVHARALSMLGLLLGAGTEPATARAIAESIAGRALPEPVLAGALTGRGFAAAKVALRPEAEQALLRGSARLTRGAQLRFRFLILGVAAIGLAGIFTGAITTLKSEGLLPGMPTPPPRDGTFRFEPLSLPTSGSP